MPPKKPANVPPTGAASPQVPGCPEPPPWPQPIAIACTPVASAVNTPWLRVLPLTLAMNAIVP